MLDHTKPVLRQALEIRRATLILKVILKETRGLDMFSSLRWRGAVCHAKPDVSGPGTEGSGDCSSACIDESGHACGLYASACADGRGRGTHLPYSRVCSHEAQIHGDTDKRMNPVC